MAVNKTIGMTVLTILFGHNSIFTDTDTVFYCIVMHKEQNEMLSFFISNELREIERLVVKTITCFRCILIF